MTSRQQQQTATMVSKSENMQVAVRLRPMTDRERQKGNKRIVEIEQNTVQLMNPKHTHDRYKKFTFDYSYWSYDGFKRNQEGVCVPDTNHPNGPNYVDQERVFRDLGQFLLDNAIAGYHSALLAYGQTGSGKSYTVSGYGANEGILPRFARAIYVELDKCTMAKNKTTNSTQDEDRENVNERYEVYFSMIEIYNEVVRDLLPGGGHNSAASQLDDQLDGAPPTTPMRAPTSSSRDLSSRALKIREHPVHGFFVENMSSYICRNKEEIERRIEEGQLNKSIAATRMNETSSRGHTIYEFRIKQYKSKPDSAKQTTRSSLVKDPSAPEAQAASYTTGDEIVTTSVVQLVDLAGSERMAVHMPEEIQAASWTLSGGIAPAGPAPAASQSRHPDRNSSNSVRSSSRSQANNAQHHRSSSVRPSNATASSGNSGNRNNSQHQQRFKESVSINQSLSALGNCIQVMSQNSQLQQQMGPNAINQRAIKIPYRDSALTKLLNRCCLSGNSKVVIIATLSPADTHFDDTLSTLRFADRAKQIRTHAVINQTSRRGSLADGGSMAAAQQALLLKQAAGRGGGQSRSKLRQINESERSLTSSQTSDKTTVPGEEQAAAARARDLAMATPSRIRPPGTRGSNKNARGGATSKRSSGGDVRFESRIASSRSNPSLARMSQNESRGSNKKQQSTSSSRKLSQQSRGTFDSRSRAINQDDDEEDQDDEEEDYDDATYNARAAASIRKSRSEHMIASQRDQDQDEIEEEEYINDLGDFRDGFISPESDDSMAALADDDLTTGEKIEILNRMLNQSGPTERILAMQEAADPQEPTTSSSKTAGQTTRRSRTSKMRADVKQVSLISSTLKKTNPYISNLNPDEQLSGVLSYMIKEGETVIGKDGDCDVVIHGTEIRAKHARITRSQEPSQPMQIYIESIMSESTADSEATSSNAQPRASLASINSTSASASVNIRVNGYAVLGKVELHHCDRILFGTNSYFVFANLSDKATPTTSQSETTNEHQVADMDLVTYEMAKSEVLRAVMQEGQNKSVIKEIKDYTHRPGTGKFKKAPQQPMEQQASEISAGGQSSVSRLESKDTVHKLTRSFTIVNSSADDPVNRSYEMNDSQPDGSSHDDQNNDESRQSKRHHADNQDQADQDQDEIYRKQLMEDTYDFVIPVAEVNAIASEMSIKVHYELKIVNGEEQLPHHAYSRYYHDSNTSDAFSSSSLGDNDNNEHQQQHQMMSGSKLAAAGRSSGSGHSESQAGSSSAGFVVAKPLIQAAGEQGSQSQQQNSNSDNQGELATANDNTSEPGVTYLSELNELDIAPALYVKVHLTEYDMTFYWHKDKFQARRYKMLELYGPWSLGGKAALVEYLIEQSRIQGNYLIDPFVDDPQNNLVLIGHAQITLQPIAHQTDKRQTYDIVNINDETVGSINVEAIPCHYLGKNTPPGGAPLASFEPFSQEDLATRLLEDSSQLLGSKLVFMLKIVSCQDLVARFSNIFCQYSFGSRNPIIRTRSFYHEDLERNEQGDKFTKLDFNHSHFVCFESVSEDLLDFLEYGFLTIQVVGQHLIPKHMVGQSPSMITTIINSINKYKSKIEQSSNFGSANYSNGDYYLESPLSSNKDAVAPNGQKAGSQLGSASGSTISNSAKTINMYNENGDFDENGMALNGISQENIIDMILTKRKLDRAENQLHYLKRTVNIAEHYNKKHIPIKVVKKLLNSYGQEVDATSIEEVANNDGKNKAAGANKKSGCSIQ